MISERDAGRYERFDRDAWAALRAQTPLTLHAKDVEALRGIADRIDLEEVAAASLPLTRLINLYVAATQSLHRVSATFLGAVAAAAAIGFINMVGNMGGFVGPVIFGGAAENKEFARGLALLAPFPLISVAIILFVGYLRRDRLPTRSVVASKT